MGDWFAWYAGGSHSETPLDPGKSESVAEEVADIVVYCLSLSDRLDLDLSEAVRSKIANVLCGGDVEPGSEVDEDWLLGLERAAFMELLATEKTQARVEHMLKTGKPLRN
ncbi:MAG: hypothetical protein HGA45_44580 [Chloroflexales bacterium]|nr:hypothetical protein [Chloroflexales bacterium]